MHSCWGDIVTSRDAVVMVARASTGCASVVTTVLLMCTINEVG